MDGRAAASGRKFAVAGGQALPILQRTGFAAAWLGVDAKLAAMARALATPCHPHWRHGTGHRLRSSAAFRAELGYVGTTSAAGALA